MSEELKVERTDRSIIEKKLMVELANNDDKIAILATKQDLETFIAAFILASLDRMAGPEIRHMLKDLNRLHDVAFPDNNPSPASGERMG